MEQKFNALGFYDYDDDDEDDEDKDSDKDDNEESPLENYEHIKFDLTFKGTPQSVSFVRYQSDEASFQREDWNLARIKYSLKNGSLVRSIADVTRTEFYNYYTGEKSELEEETTDEPKSFEEIVQHTYRDISKIRLAAYFETLEYLYRGGRIGKARALFGSLLHVKPLILVKDGEVQPLCYARTRTGALRRLRDYAKSLSPIRELAVMYGENKESADTLFKMLSDLCEENHIIQTQAGVTLGVHAGAQTLALAALLE